MVCRVSVTSSVVRETRNSPSFAGFPKSSLRLLAGPAPFTGVAVSAGTRRCARSPVQLFRCRVGRGRDSAARVFATTATEKASPWWARQKELWTEVESEEHFYELVEQAGRERKLLLIDFYATWCHACQKVYPTLCLMAEDPKLTKNILFAKLQVDKFKTLVKKEGLTMLPVVRGYGNEGKFLFECSASPKKVKKLRQNLNTVLADTSRSYYEDPMGVLQPETEEMMARKAEKEAELKRLAKEKAALAKTMDNLASNGNGSARSVPRVKELNSKDPSKTQDPRKRMFLEKYKADYGYGGMIDELYQREIGSRLSENEHYMDYTAAALYCNSVIDNAMNELKSAVFGNPHSAAPSSVRTDTKIEAIRERILRHFNADPAEYQCVFTRGATASLKLVGETFPWSDKSRFVYLRENHNSVLGQRQYALAHGASFQAVDEDWVDTWLFGDNSESQDIDESLASPPGDGAEEPVYSLFAFPGEDNFAGVKYPLEWIHGVRAKSTENTKWFSMLDAAAFVHAQPLDLTAYPADFVSISFYKMFGYPTGLGALIIRTENVELLKKVFWGGGSVSLATSADNFHVLKCKPSERLEDGTVSFLDIIALEHGFNMVEKLGGRPARGIGRRACLAPTDSRWPPNPPPGAHPPTHVPSRLSGKDALMAALSPLSLILSLASSLRRFLAPTRALRHRGHDLQGRP
mmetsp:Transcript_24514/g.58276  ORF Transcript_24514/g.58276 Transcript_24514/m.58276 type:complete len:692 (-) Transcript_24514:359-2434(-)